MDIILPQIRSGWSPITDSWTYNSTDNPTGVINWSGANSKVSAGMRIRFNNGGNTIYGIVMAVTGSTMTFLHEMNEANNNAVNLMANSAITNPRISPHKAPLGFNGNLDKWSVIVTDVSDRSVNSPAANQKYNISQLNIVLPIGAWDMYYSFCGYMTRDSSGINTFCVTLSTGSTTESNNAFTSKAAIRGAFDGTRLDGTYAITRNFRIATTSKTTYYTNLWTPDTSVIAMQLLGGSVYGSTSVIRATCAYL